MIFIVSIYWNVKHGSYVWHVMQNCAFRKCLWPIAIKCRLTVMWNFITHEYKGFRRIV